MKRYDDTLCVHPGCAIRGRHGSGCDDETCRGCMVAAAADGLMLCVHHRDKLEQRIAELPALHDDLATCLVASGGTGDAKRRSQGISLDGDVVAARDHVLMWLWSWTRIVMEERGLHGPSVETPNAVATWLVQHVDWLAAKPYAGEVSAELAETWREARRALQAGRVRRIELRLPDGELARCLAEAEGPSLDGERPTCNGTLVALLRPTDSLLPHAVVCSGDSSHVWPAGTWQVLRKRFAPQMDAAALMRLTRAISA